MLKVEFSQYTPYFLFLFGIIITYIGWTTKKILENIEYAIKNTSEKVDNHDYHISEILSILKIHDFKIEILNSEVVQLKKDDRINTNK